MDEKQIQELKAQHGNDLAEVEFHGQSFVFRKPKRAEYDYWIKKVSEDATQAGRELSQQCIVFPSAAEMFAAIDETPALLRAQNGFVDTITELAGLTKGGILATKKKL